MSSSRPLHIQGKSIDKVLFDSGNYNFSLLHPRVLDKLPHAVFLDPHQHEVQFLGKDINIRVLGSVTLSVSCIDHKATEHETTIFFVVADIPYWDIIINKDACRLNFGDLFTDNRNWVTMPSGIESSAVEDEGIEYVPAHFSDYVCSLLPDIDLYDEISPEDGSPKQAFPTLVQKYIDVFTPDEIFKGILIPPLHLEVSPDLPREIYTVPRSHRQDINIPLQNTINDYLRLGLHVPSTSVYCSPIVPVRKSPTDVRIAVDYNSSGINKYVLSPSHPIPRISDITHSLSQFRVYAEIDLLKAYRQIPIDDASSRLLSYVTRFGQFQPNSLPEGVRSACSYFQAVMDRLFYEFHLEGWLQCYFDNIWIGADTESDLEMKLEKVFIVCRQVNMKLSLSKCNLCTKSVYCLGYTISHNTIKPSKKRIDAIRNINTPHDKPSLHSFLGSIVMFGRFIDNFSSKLAILHDLIKKDVAFNWLPSHQKAFDSIKAEIMDNLVLYYPDHSKQWILRTDASTVGVGGVLVQIAEDGSEEPIGFCSQKLSPAATKWITYEQELYGIVFSLRFFQELLYGKEFIIQTDHRNLTFLKSSEVPKIQRWLLFMQSFHFSIYHIPGKTNHVADMLSRCHVIYQKESEVLLDDNILLNEYIIPAHQGTGFCSHHPVGVTLDTVIRQLHTDNYIVTSKNDLRSLIKNYITKCYMCQKLNRHLPALEKQYRSLTNFSSESVIGIDSVGPLPVDIHGNRYILVVKDHYDRVVKFYPTKDRETENYLHCLLQVCGDWGCPRAIRTDNDKEFTSNLCDKLNALLNIQRSVTIPWNPTGNSIVERANKELIHKLTLIIYHHAVFHSWSRFLPIIQFCMNNTFNRQIGMCPFRLRFGNRRYSSLNQWLDIEARNTNDPTSPESLFDEINNDFNVVQQLANLILDREIDYLISKDPSPTSELVIGNLILVTQPDNELPHKLSPRWRGPYQILKITDNKISAEHVITLKQYTFDVSQCRKFYTNTPDDITTAAALDSKSFVITEIKNHRGNHLERKRMDFYVNYNVADSTTEWSSYYLVKSSAAFKSYCEDNNLHMLLLPDKDYHLYVKSSKKAQLKKEKENNKQIEDFRNSSPVKAIKFDNKFKVLYMSTNDVSYESLVSSSKPKPKRKSKINSSSVTHSPEPSNPYDSANFDLKQENSTVPDTSSSSRYPVRIRHPAKRG